MTTQQASRRPKGFFDRLAERVSRGVSRAWFFAGCLAGAHLDPSYWVLPQRTCGSS